MMLPTLLAVPMHEVIENSFRDFHVKGFDYICLRRSPKITVKVYFFDGDVCKLPEVVNPHDHRYDFKTMCIAGSVENLWFSRQGTVMCDDVYTRFDYRTPLNGGSGFTFSGTERLRQVNSEVARAGQTYGMRHEEIHTIRMVESETVIALVQYEDAVKIGAPTSTWTRDREPPSLDGLYRRFDADTIRSRLARLKERVPSLVLPEVI